MGHSSLEIYMSTRETGGGGGKCPLSFTFSFCTSLLFNFCHISEHFSLEITCPYVKQEGKRKDIHCSQFFAHIFSYIAQVHVNSGEKQE